MFTPNQKQQQKQRQIELAADKVFEESTVEEVRSKISAAHKDITNRTREINVYIGKHHNELVNVTDAVIKLADTTSVLQKEVCASEKELETSTRLRKEYMARRAKMHTKSDLEKGLNEKCDFPRRPLDKVLDQEIPKEIKLYHIGCLMKSVVEAPEKIARHLEKSEFINAIYEYFSARKSYSDLKESKSAQVKSILKSALLVERQWENVAEAPSQITEACWKSLSGRSFDSNLCESALCGIFLLNPKAPETLLKEFLSARHKADISILENTNESVSQNLKNLISSICLTLYLSDRLFCSQTISGGKTYADIKPCIIIQVVKPFFDSPIIPAEISESLVKLNSFQSVSLIPWERVKNECKSWIETIIPVLLPFVSQQLSMVPNASELSTVALSIQEFLSTSEPSWKSEPQRILGDSSHLWENLLEKPLLERAVSIIESHFNALEKGVAGKVDEALAGDLSVESNIGQWVWSDAGVSSDSVLSDTIKSRASFVSTPQISILLNWFDSKMSDSINDISNVVYFVDTKSFTKQTLPGIFSKNERVMREKTLDALTESLKVLAIDLNDRMNRQPQESYNTRLFIGQVAYSVSLRAYKLDNHMNATKTEDLLRVYTGSLEFWANKVSTSLLSDFQDSLENYKEDWYDNERRRSWEKIAIGTEEVELPTQPTTALSTLILNLSQVIVSNTSHTLPRASFQSLIRQLSTGLLTHYTTLISTPATPEYPVEALVQILFDVCYIGDIFSSRVPYISTRVIAGDSGIAGFLGTAFKGTAEGDNWPERVGGVIEKLQKRFDPVDFEFFKARLRAALAKCYSRSNVLLGFVNPGISSLIKATAAGAGGAQSPAGLKSSLSSTSASSLVGGQQHSVVSLVKPAPIFGVLPTTSGVSLQRTTTSSTTSSVTSLRNESMSLPATPIKQDRSSQQQQQHQQEQERPVYSFLRSLSLTPQPGNHSAPLSSQNGNSGSGGLSSSNPLGTSFGKRVLSFLSTN